MPDIPRPLTPVKVRDLPAFLKALEPVARAIADGDVVGAITRHADGVITATAIGAGVDREWLADQTPDVLAELAAQVLEVNADFFARAVLPPLTRVLEHLAQTPAVSGGTSGSPGSSPSASDTRT